MSTPRAALAALLLLSPVAACGPDGVASQPELEAPAAALSPEAAAAITTLAADARDRLAPAFAPDARPQIEAALDALTAAAAFARPAEATAAVAALDHLVADARAHADAPADSDALALTLIAVRAQLRAVERR